MNDILRAPRQDTPWIAMGEVSRDAWAFGTGFLKVTRREDGVLEYESVSPERISIKDEA